MARNDPASSGFESILPLVDAARQAPPAPLAERFVRALCLVGLLVALGSALRLVGPIWGFGWRELRFPRRSEPAMVAATVGWVCLLVAAALLALGAVGEFFKRRWARSVLALYLMTWLIGGVAAAGSQFAHQWAF